MDTETLYRHLGRLIESMPDFSGYAPATADQLMWIGRCDALLKESGDIALQAEFSLASKMMLGPAKIESLKTIAMVMYKALAAAELKAPPSAQGAFIPAGNRFDAFAALTKVLHTANKDVLIVDPYMDETILTDFAGSVPAGANLRLLSDQSSVKPSLEPAALSWVTQYGPSRLLAVRLTTARTLHDRAIFIDRTTAWILTQSLKDFAKRSPAEIVRADETASLKISAYEAVWNDAIVIV